MKKVLRYLALLLVGVLAGGCDTDYTLNGPTNTKTQSLVASSATVLAVTPSPLIGQPIANSFCPATPPFAVPFQLNIQGGDIAVSISDITMRFTDSFNIQMPPVTLPAPALTAQFGSIQVPARSIRTIPLSFRFGCGTARRGILVVVVRTVDSNGRAGLSEISAQVH